MALAGGQKVAQACRPIGVNEKTFYRWPTEYGGLRMDEVKSASSGGKELETENVRLKRAIADLTLDKQILREAAEGNF